MLRYSIIIINIIPWLADAHKMEANGIVNANAKPNIIDATTRRESGRGRCQAYTHPPRIPPAHVHAERVAGWCDWCHSLTHHVYVVIVKHTTHSCMPAAILLNK